MLLPPLLAGAAGCLVGLAPWTIEPLVGAVARSLVPSAPASDLALWHGWTPELALSLATLAAGVAAYRAWPRTQPVLADIETMDRLGPERAWEGLVARTLDLAKAQTARLQDGSLRVYVGATVSVVSVATALALILGGGLAIPALTVEPAQLAVAALLFAAAVVVALASDHALVAFMAAGVAGFGAAVLFLLGGAPDLAFTQIAVEALAIVLFLAVLGRLPLRRPDPRPRRERRRDAWIAVGFGTLMASLLMSVLAAPMDGALADWFRANSLPAAHGRNVVNVIIVDFRALDTLGEIAVLAFAALGAIALVRGVRRLAP
jgi:multicomponent Na+:H+ antiporter subunit A